METGEYQLQHQRPSPKRSPTRMHRARHIAPGHPFCNAKISHNSAVLYRLDLGSCKGHPLAFVSIFTLARFLSVYNALSVRCGRGLVGQCLPQVSTEGQSCAGSVFCSFILLRNLPFFYLWILFPKFVATRNFFPQLHLRNQKYYCCLVRKAGKMQISGHKIPVELLVFTFS